jgi:hypothetical protein
MIAEPDDVVVELTTAEFHAAARRALVDVGLTYRELADQARRRDFDSDRANLLWVSIGDTLPDDFE